MTVTAVQGDWVAFHQRALNRVAVPGVQHAAFAWGVPPTGNNWPVPTEIEGQPVATKASDRVTLPFRSVTPDFFQLTGFQLTEGREFRATDTSGQPQVAVVNQAFADRYFPHAPAIGRRVWAGSRTDRDGRPSPRFICAFGKRGPSRRISWCEPWATRAPLSVMGNVLILVGLYGILSLSVTSRRRELAIRSAVGAEQRHIHRLVFR